MANAVDTRNHPSKPDAVSETPDIHSSGDTINTTQSNNRHFLFLQGVSTPFFNELAKRLRREGHKVSRINFCGGDRHFWNLKGAWNFRGKESEFAFFLQDKLTHNAITELVLFGDNRPLHRTAIEIAESAGLEIHVFEEGYIRPNWATLERGGVNAHSRLPRDPAWYREVSRHIPERTEIREVPTSLASRAYYDIRYHLGNLRNPLLYPHYETHRPYKAPVEYAGWIKRFSLNPIYKRHAEREITGLLTADTPYFLLPLQLNADSQIAVHSPYNSMREVLEVSICSFAHHAPRDSHLVIKNHPLDTGFVHYPRIIHALIRHLGIDPMRVHYLEHGDLDLLLKHAQGSIMVNSTVGVLSLSFGRPTCVLGEAIYQMPGLTHQGDLDSFWHQPESPDPALFDAFRKTVIHTTQINGGFYTTGGIEMAVEDSLRLLTPESALSQLL